MRVPESTCIIRKREESSVKLWSPLLIHDRFICHDVVNRFATCSPDVAHKRRGNRHTWDLVLSRLSRELSVTRRKLGAKYR